MIVTFWARGRRLDALCGEHHQQQQDALQGQLAVGGGGWRAGNYSDDDLSQEEVSAKGERGDSSGAVRVSFAAV
jgi:hypothetical protein